jgi:hypothetical protein
LVRLAAVQDVERDGRVYELFDVLVNAYPAM